MSTLVVGFWLFRHAVMRSFRNLCPAENLSMPIVFCRFSPGVRSAASWRNEALHPLEDWLPGGCRS